MKPRILIVSDSAFIDTGFGRVAREIGMGLHMTGRYEVVQLGWFHQPTDKFVPFNVINTEPDPQYASKDAYGELSFDHVIRRVQPHMVLTIGDEWMVNHIAMRPRNYTLIGYFPIDSGPVKRSWVRTFAMYDVIVAFGPYGKGEINLVAPEIPVRTIPHGVDTDTFMPLPPEEREKCRLMVGHNPGTFVIGCVARNNVRKQLPRLLQAYRTFLDPWCACNDCGEILFGEPALHLRKCGSCRSGNLRKGDHKDKVRMYLHTVLNDAVGHDLLPLIGRHRLQNYMAVPDNITAARGVPDTQLNMFYNGMDLFTLPTSGEGWGLPILEAMATGTPVLVTEYSAHVDYVSGAGEFISVQAWDTHPGSNTLRALTDERDHAMKMDRFYLEHDDFVGKWGSFMRRQGGVGEDFIERLDCGRRLREGLGKMARQRALEYTWPKAVAQWIELFDAVTQAGALPTINNTPVELEVI
jgi:glycosyltransferase involved in cell wall biosynthesis